MCNVRSHASFVGNAKKYNPALKKLKNHLGYNTEILGNITSHAWPWMQMTCKFQKGGNDGFDRVGPGNFMEEAECKQDREEKKKEHSRLVCVWV